MLSIVTSDYDRSPFDLILPEEVLYDSVMMTKMIISVPSCRVVDSLDFFVDCQKADDLFEYRFMIYCKLRQQSW